MFGYFSTKDYSWSFPRTAILLTVNGSVYLLLPTILALQHVILEASIGVTGPQHHQHAVRVS